MFEACDGGNFATAAAKKGVPNGARFGASKEDIEILPQDTDGNEFRSAAKVRDKV